MPSNIPGYLLPTTPALPGGLTLEQFIQTVMVGITGFTGALCRPKWQPAPPKQPDISTNWMTFGLQILSSPGNAYVGVKADGLTSELGRQETLMIPVSFYGPNAVENAAAFRDGFQIQQNLEALRSAKMGFQECQQAVRVPELVNERWFNRVDITLVLVRRVIRTYQILSFTGAGGMIHTTTYNEEYTSTWETPAEE